MMEARSTGGTPRSGSRTTRPGRRRCTTLERRKDAVRFLSARLRARQARLLHLGFPSPSQASLPSSPTAATRRGLLQDHHHYRHPFSDSEDDDHHSV
ncbi:hypothetical protein BAE44_0024098 [Dichanthelium oligosanthes]|uniref:Uncharacterized protein n=1 Tax=Dichanthelium oligosanthes TaxID=888268 RepID=A0A1E5UPQ5_9POAL|nr:hypothetical protein BAE44_0024098 [Dichanthelium oligosanthes]